MDKKTIVQRAQMQAEFESQVWQIMTRVKRGATVPNRNQYRRVMALLRARAQALYHNPDIRINAESDWLALTLYAEDKPWFVEMCAAAADAQDAVYLNARKWIASLIDRRINDLTS